MKCPGQDSRYWKEGAIFEVKCPECGREMEFFQDDAWRRCKHCGYRLQNPRLSFGCAEYCPFAAQCIGDLPQELLETGQDAPLKDKVAVEVKRFLRGDFLRIAQSVKVARYIEKEVDTEDLNFPALVLSAYLMPVVAKLKEDEHRSMEECMEGVKEILSAAGTREDLVRDVEALLVKVFSTEDDRSLDDGDARLLKEAFREVAT